MQFAHIGQQLRAFRLESGLRAEEIAARLGVSRAALYRYEKGEVIKLDTIRRLAELLNISPLTLLGMGIEYFSRPIGFVERVASLEEDADHIIFIGGSFCPLIMSADVDAFLLEVWPGLSPNKAEHAVSFAAHETLLAQLAGRRRRYQQRKPVLNVVLGEASIRLALSDGFMAGVALSDAQRRRAIALAHAETERLASLMEDLPMGLQLGVLEGPEVNTPFQLLRGREKTHVCASPFRIDIPPNLALGIATVTAADEAVTSYQRIAETAWSRALKGSEGAARLRHLLADSSGSARGHKPAP